MVSEVLVIGHGQKIKIIASFGLSNGYRTSLTSVRQEYLRSDTMPDSAQAGRKI